MYVDYYKVVLLKNVFVPHLKYIFLQGSKVIVKLHGSKTNFETSVTQ